ncbi:hypothetical protein [Pyxidicoccus sp. MSG2]|uniref:hypothetical protein n=1 Tax=Pyxidicoccus sp. MSG2 TaxID=2996790 RepID=UPI00226EE282|nr:hypothetical protein [Pyxidicoccus sp. MSG2]MCY1019250.1 hypothetical protein [Pyxidicoccus sp. MSG2]
MDARERPLELCPPELEYTATDACRVEGETQENICCFDSAGVPRYAMREMDGPIDTTRACDTSRYVRVGRLECPPDNRIPDETPQTECEEKPAPCCSSPDGLYYAVGSTLYSQHTRSVRERIPKTRLTEDGSTVIVRDENGDIVYAEGPEHEVTELDYQTCVPTCAGVEDAGACECVEVRCCEDEENGDLYAEYGMPDHSATVLFQQEKDPVTGRVERVIPARCPQACKGWTTNVGYCAQICEHPVRSENVRPETPPEDPEEKKKKEELIRCDECPSDPETARQTSCDPCPPELELGLAGTELAKYCAQLPARLLEKPERFADEVKQRIHDIDAQVQDATRGPRRVLEALQQRLLDGLGASGFDSLSLPGAPRNLCDSTSPSYAACLRNYQAQVDDFIAHPPGGLPLPPEGLDAWTRFKDAAAPYLDALEQAQRDLTDAIAQAQSAGLDLTTPYDDFINRALARLGKQPLGSLCAGLSAEALDDCIDDALDSAREELERLSKACQMDTSKSESCKPRLCEGDTANRAREQLDDLETLPGEGLGWNEFPQDACCTQGSADFLVNSAPKKWEAGQFFQRSTRLGVWGWGWSAAAGRNLWVALVTDPSAGDMVDTGAWAYMTAGLQVLVPKPPFLSGLPVPHPACIIDAGSKACSRVAADPWPELRFGRRIWLASAKGQGNARLTYSGPQGFQYDWGIRTEVKILEEVAWEFERSDSGAAQIEKINHEWEMFDQELFPPWSYTVYTPIPFFVEVGAYGRAVAYVRFAASRKAIGMGAEAGVGGGVSAYLEGGIGVSLLGGRIKIGAGIDAVLVVLKVRAGARVEGGIQQLPPTNPERKVVLAGYCFTVPYEMRMLEGEVNVFAQMRIRLGFVRINKRWSKRLFKWEGEGLSGMLWERCETKCYDYEGTPAPEVMPPEDPLPPLDALPGPDRPPCWPHFKYPSVSAVVLGCQNELHAAGLSVTDMCLGRAPRPPACQDFPCGPFADIQDTVTDIAGAVGEDIDRAKHSWQATVEAYATLFPLPGLAPPHCDIRVDKATFDCLKAYVDSVRTDPSLAAWRAANQATLDELVRLESEWNARIARYEQLLSEARGDYGRLKDLVDTVASGEQCTCDHALSELGTRGSPLKFKCGGEKCGAQRCDDPCPAPYPNGPGYPDPRVSRPFSSDWNACCPLFAPNCAPP